MGSISDPKRVPMKIGRDNIPDDFREEEVLEIMCVASLARNSVVKESREIVGS